mgnify:CR=1 FL=1
MNIPYFKELKTLDDGAHLTRQLVYKQKVEIEELTEINIENAKTINDQEKLIYEMMVVIKDQNKTLIHALILVIIAWAYAFFSIAWCS